jgi:copper/silver efflux system protein
VKRAKSLTANHNECPPRHDEQITYPIVSSLIAAPRVKYVRGISMVGDSFVYVVFEDGTDIY